MDPGFDVPIVAGPDTFDRASNHSDNGMDNMKSDIANLREILYPSFRMVCRLDGRK